MTDESRPYQPHAAPALIWQIGRQDWLTPCSISQVGDREWWCATHRRNAEDCDNSRGHNA